MPVHEIVRETTYSYSPNLSPRAGSLLWAGLLALAASSLIPSRLPGQVPEPSYLVVDIRYYDLEGKGGYDYPGPEGGDALLQGSFLEVYRPGSDTPRFVVESILPAIIEVGDPAGEPFTFRCVAPAAGVFEGLGRVMNSGERIFNARYSLPVTSEAAGRTLSILGGPLSRTEPTNDLMFGVSPIISNDHDCAGAVVAANGVAFSDRACSVSVEYLPGNTLESMDTTMVTYSNWDRNPLNLYWGTYYPEGINLEHNTRVLNEVAPSGPVRVTIFVDGYETDSVETTISNHMGYSWKPLLRPRPDRPDVPRPDPSLYRFERVPISQEVRRGILDANTRTHILMDDNLDGVIDIADLVHARGSE